MVLGGLLKNSRLSRFAEFMLGKEDPLDVRVGYLSLELIVLVDEFFYLLLDGREVVVVHQFAIFLFPSRRPALIIVLVGPFEPSRSLNSLNANNRNIDVFNKQTSDIFLLKRA
jgi:hypothetical protein